MLTVTHTTNRFDKNKTDEVERVKSFLKSILVEVVSENYRYLMYHTAFDRKEGGADKKAIDPPIRDNEVVLAGLFSTAISRLCPRYRTEMRIDRKNEDQAKKTGRADFVAWHGDFVVAIELKASHMSFTTEKCTENASKKWDEAIEQAKSSLGFLEENKADGSKYYSVALMAIIGREDEKSINKKLDSEESLNEILKNFDKAMIDDLKPDFYAKYTIPKDFRTVPRRRSGATVTGELSCNPVVGFAAKILFPGDVRTMAQ